MNTISIFGHLNYLLTLVSYMVKDMLRLRVLAIVAGCCGITYSLFYTNTVLWVEFMWESAGIAVNLVHIIIILRERGNLFFTEEETALYLSLFNGMSKFDYKRLLKAGTWRDYSPGKDIIREGKTVRAVSVISCGTAEIISKGNIVAYCSRGALLGEMSYITGEPASATVRAGELVRCFVWEHESLRDITEKNPAIKQGFQSALNENFIRKIQKHKEPIRPVAKEKGKRKKKIIHRDRTPGTQRNFK